MAEHTPGPWIMHEDDPTEPVWVLGPDPENTFIAQTRYILRDGPNESGGDQTTKLVPELGLAEELANARLIAQAPELLAACEAIVQWAINMDSTWCEICHNLERKHDEGCPVEQAEIAIGKATKEEHGDRHERTTDD